LEFARFLAADLAERLPQKGPPLKRGQRRRESIAGEVVPVPLRGRHITYSGRVPFRGSDAKRRLHLIVAACQCYLEAEKQRGASLAATCRLAAQVILSAGDLGQDRQLLGLRPDLKNDAVYRPILERWRQRLLQGKRGRKPRAGSVERSELKRLADVIRVEVYAYRKHPLVGGDQEGEFGHEFNTWYEFWFLPQALTQSHGPDPDREWIEQRAAHENREIERLRWVVALRKKLEESGRLSASELKQAREILGLHPTASCLRVLKLLKPMSAAFLHAQLASRLVYLAWLRQAQGEYEEAIQVYRQALGIYRGKVKLETRRGIVPWIEQQIERCHQGQPPTAFPLVKPSGRRPDSAPRSG